jgi:uncharacterized membrane protein YgdD (TMEM256/DUF423 family)
MFFPLFSSFFLLPSSINIMSTLILIRIFIAAAAVFGGLSVAGGAFASHALKNQLSDRALAIFETGARYQMYHALALLLVALLLSYAQESQTFFAVAGWAFIAGTIIFSGSLYALSLTDIKWLGAITPLGGVAFIVGWGCLAVAAFNFK